MSAHRRCLLAGQAQPAQKHFVGMLAQAFNRAQTIPFAQQGKHLKDRQSIAADRFKERAFVRIEGLPTSATGIALLDIAMNHNVAGINLAYIAAPLIGTPLAFSLHGASPPRRSMIRPGRLSRLR
jgi:hypothetical protein